MSDSDELARLRAQAREDRKLLRRAAEALAEIDRAQGLSDNNADVLAALRIRVEGRERASLEDLLSAAGPLSGRRDLPDVTGNEKESSDWPVIENKKKDWPGL
jgi:hypothetical protein